MNKLIKVGTYKDKFNTLLHLRLPVETIYMSDGLPKHIEKRHPNCTKYISQIPSIIESPDYIGVNPKEPNSIELIKKFDNNIEIGIKLDTTKSYLYVATLYDITESKITKRLSAGRITPFNKNFS